MITTEQNTASQWVQVGEVEDEKRSKRARIFSKPSDSTFETQVFRIMLPDIGSAFHRWWGEVEQDRLFALQGKLLDDFHKALIDRIVGPSKRETLSVYPMFNLTGIEPYYEFRNYSQVLRFLEINAFLIAFLEDAHKRIEHYFGASTDLALSVTTDPEAEEYEELVISIKTSLSPEKALEKLRQCDEEWWLNTPFSVREKVCIDVEFT